MFSSGTATSTVPRWLPKVTASTTIATSGVMTVYDSSGERRARTTELTFADGVSAVDRTSPRFAMLTSPQPRVGRELGRSVHSSVSSKCT